MGPLLAIEFYNQVLLELLAAVGAALFVGNLMALIRRRRKAPPTGGGSGKSGKGRTDLETAPLARTVTYLVIGFVVMVAGLGSLLATL